MKCKTIEQQIIVILEGKELKKNVKEHIKECSSCRGFYEYIIGLKQEFTDITIFEPSSDLEERILKEVLKEPVYNKIFALLISSLTFVFMIFLPHILKSLFPQIIITFSKITTLCQIFSDIFDFKICYMIPAFISLFILTNLFILWASFFFLKKFAFKEVKS